MWRAIPCNMQNNLYAYLATTCKPFLCTINPSPLASFKSEIEPTTTHTHARGMMVCLEMKHFFWGGSHAGKNYENSPTPHMVMNVFL